jgi:hypothetical protein
MDHCDGPTLPLKDALDEILSLQKKLSTYSKRTINYLSVMKYDDETVGIDWHNHNEDFGIDTPLLIISTGAQMAKLRQRAWIDQWRRECSQE